jgi:hypothetical protein
LILLAGIAGEALDEGGLGIQRLHLAIQLTLFVIHRLEFCAQFSLLLLCRLCTEFSACFYRADA